MVGAAVVWTDVVGVPGTGTGAAVVGAVVGAGVADTAVCGARLATAGVSFGGGATVESDGCGEGEAAAGEAPPGAGWNVATGGAEDAPGNAVGGTGVGPPDADGAAIPDGDGPGVSAPGAGAVLAGGRLARPSLPLGLVPVGPTGNPNDPTITANVARQRLRMPRATTSRTRWAVVT